MQRYIMDRERIGHDSEERDRTSSEYSYRSMAPQERREFEANERFQQRAADAEIRHERRADEAVERYEMSRAAWQSRQPSTQTSQSEARARAYRRNFLDNPATAPSPWLQQTITYLAQLRSSQSYEDSLSFAVDAGFVTKEFFGDSHDDFVLEPGMLPVPAETSWLSPGAVFSGSQHATAVTASIGHTPGSTTTRHVWRDNSQLTSTPFDSSLPRPTDFNPARPWSSHHIPPAPRSHERQYQTTLLNHPQDRWPVKVTIHSVDYNTMTLSATMEAYNVPSHPSSSSILHDAISQNRESTPRSSSRNQNQSHPTTFSTSTHPNNPLNSPTTNLPTSTPTNRVPKTSSITTYLEGEILDFRTHTLLTESFDSTLSTDATYWRKLEPFADCATYEALVRRLVSRKEMQKLNEGWVLMRWKERCFVKPSSASSSANNPSLISSGDGAGGAVRYTDNDTHMHDNGEDGYGTNNNNDSNHSSNQIHSWEDGCGLTISGFYYVCLRRRDGEIEGLYCDPQSSPYQHLRLSRVGGGCFPVWGFR